MQRLDVAVWLVLGGAAIACGSSSESSNDERDETSDDCRLVTTLSGGVEASLGGTSPACLFSSGVVSFVPLDEKENAAVTLSIRGIDAGQTGSFPADMDVTSNKERWSNATCTVNVESNVKDAANSTGDGGVAFDRYILKGNGSCTTPATFRDGAKPPVTIAPFTFVASMLFY